MQSWPLFLRHNVYLMLSLFTNLLSFSSRWDKSSLVYTETNKSTNEILYFLCCAVEQLREIISKFKLWLNQLT